MFPNTLNIFHVCFSLLLVQAYYNDDDQVNKVLNLTLDLSSDQKFDLVFQISNQLNQNRRSPRVLDGNNETVSVANDGLEPGNMSVAEESKLPKVVLEYIQRRYFSRRKRPLSAFRGADNRTGGDSVACDLFSNNVCLKTYDYPLDDILATIDKNREYVHKVLIDQIGNKYIDDFDDNILERSDDNNGFLCKSVIKFAKPQKARAATGAWKYIVNTAEHAQTLRLEKCLESNGSCLYLNDNYDTRCLQVYNYQRLLSWDKTKGLHLDVFKVPTCCSCHVDNYKVHYPPHGHKAPLSKTHLQQITGSEIEHGYDNGDYPISNTRYVHSDNDFSEQNLPLFSKLYDEIQKQETKKKIRRVKPKKNFYLDPNNHNADDSDDVNHSYHNDDEDNDFDQISGFQYGVKRKKNPSYYKDNRANNELSISDLFIDESMQVTTKIVPRVHMLSTVTKSKKRINFNYHPIIDYFGPKHAVAADSQRLRRYDNVNEFVNVAAKWKPTNKRRIH